ncbi:MAG: hypothetical protein HFJ59_07590 [Clostridia bacterium]|nr:hypothetical protein [Clostridia bacterium]
MFAQSVNSSLFGIGESKELVRNFKKETCTFINPVKQLKYEEQEKE